MNGNKIFGAPLDWLRRNLEPQQPAEQRKESRSQSLVPTSSSNTSKKLLTHQRSLDYAYNDPFDEEDEFELHGNSKVLDDKQDEAKFLSKHLPPRLTGNDWYQIFSTEQNGFSLSTLYRNARNKDPELKIPTLLLIRDTDNQRFGAFLSECPKISEKSFGCGETFVFSLTQHKAYKWNGDPKSNFFIVCKAESLSVGVSDGKFAIDIDAALNQGRSQACQTFQNEPLTPKEDFVASHVELWTFR